jgi:hypothetical protein
MSDSPPSAWLSISDAVSFSCILVAIEELGRSLVPHGGPTMPWRWRISFAVIGVAFSFLGRKGPQMWQRLLNLLPAKALKEENRILKAEITELKSRLEVQALPDAYYELKAEYDRLKIEHVEHTRITTGANDSQPIYTIAFDYLPTSPLEEGWKQSYNADGVAEYGSDPDIPGSLRIRILKSEVAIHYDLPPHARLANHVEYTIKMTNSTMIFTRLIVTSRDGKNTRNVDFKYYYGDLNAAPTWPNPNPGRDANKWIPEQVLHWPAELLPGEKLHFKIDLRQAVSLALGSQGWVLKSVEGFRLRSNLSISPIVFRNVKL